MKTIVVAIDFSELTSGLIKYAKRISKFENGKLLLVHSATMDVYLDTSVIASPTIYESIEVQKRAVKEKMDELVQNLKEKGFECEGMIVDSPIANAVLKIMNDSKADLLILGTHKHGKLYHLLMGNIHESILSRTNCPVLLVPPSK